MPHIHVAIAEPAGRKLEATAVQATTSYVVKDFYLNEKDASYVSFSCPTKWKPDFLKAATLKAPNIALFSPEKCNDSFILEGCISC